MTATLPWVDSILDWYASMQQTDRGKAGAVTRSAPPELLNHRRDVANTIACPAGWHPYYQSFLARFHHSATRRHQLDRLLQRLATRGVTLDQLGELTDRLPDTTSAHELHRQLQALIDATKLTYPEFSGQIVAHTAP